MESTLAKKITTKFVFMFWDIFINFFILFVTFLFSHVTLFSITKNLMHIIRNKIKKDHDNWLKNNKVIKSQKI